MCTRSKSLKLCHSDVCERGGGQLRRGCCKLRASDQPLATCAHSHCRKKYIAMDFLPSSIVKILHENDISSDEVLLCLNRDDIEKLSTGSCCEEGGT